MTLAALVFAFSQYITSPAYTFYVLVYEGLGW